MKHPYSTIFSFSWPLIIANLSVPLLGIIDTAVLGHLNHPRYLAAVSVGASLVTLILTSANFLKMSATSLAAKNFQKPINHSLTLFKSSVFFALLLAFFILIMSPIFAHIGTKWLIDSNSSHQILANTTQYVQIRLFAAPATLLNFIIVGWAIAWQKPKLALISMTSTAMVNILLDIVFIIILDLSTKGAAYASLIAEYVGLVCGAWGFYRSFPQLIQQNWCKFPTFNKLREIIKVNTDISIRSFSLLFAMAYLNSQSTKLGVSTTAINAILLQIVFLQSYILDGITQSAEALVGSQKNPDLQRFWIRKTLMASILSALLMCLLLTLIHPWIAPIFSAKPSIINGVKTLLIWVIWLPLISIFCYWLDSIAIAVTASKAMRNSTMIATFICFIPACWLLTPFGNHGLWTAFAIFILARSWLLFNYLKPYFKSLLIIK